MIARRYETIVGIFVVASLAALLVMVLIVAQQEGLFQEYVKYRTIFKNVSGLKAGSEVHLAGVTVGNVLSTAINPEGNIVVTFQVLKKNSDRIREDSRSTIGFMGLLGDKSLDLTSGSLNKAADSPGRPGDFGGAPGYHPAPGPGGPQPGGSAKSHHQPGVPHR